MHWAIREMEYAIAKEVDSLTRSDIPRCQIDKWKSSTFPNNNSVNIHSRVLNSSCN